MTDDQIEQEALGRLCDIGYTHRLARTLPLTASIPAHDYRQVTLLERLGGGRRNRNITTTACEAAVQQLRDLDIPRNCRPITSFTNCSGMTLILLWEEHLADHADAQTYSYLSSAL